MDEVEKWKQKRLKMVENQLEKRGISNEAVLSAFRSVPRHEFVPEEQRAESYRDGPLPIGEGQTISQPYIVAEMIAALEPEGEDSVLEIGTGSGYAAAVLSRIVEHVYGVERHEILARKAERIFAQLDYDNISLRVGDGTRGWPEKAPFDGIMVSAAAPEVPRKLLDQLTDNGKLVIPVGDRGLQELQQLCKSPDGTCSKKSLGGVRFVPLIGEEGWNNSLL